MDKKNIEDIVALTPMQEGMLFHYLKDPGSDLYFEQLSLDITGRIDFPLKVDRRVLGDLQLGIESAPGL